MLSISELPGSISRLFIHPDGRLACGSGIRAPEHAAATENAGEIQETAPGDVPEAVLVLP